MKTTTRNLFLVAVWFSLIAMACNLSGTSPEPPTLVPGGRLAATPKATLGVEEAPPGESAPRETQASQQQQIEAEIYNMFNQVQTDRLLTHVNAMVSVHTRHVNSSWSDEQRGIGAAYSYIMSELRDIQTQSQGNFQVFEGGHPFDIIWNGVSSTQRNAIGYLRGTEAGAGTMVIGAHYDSRTYDINDSDSFAPGAVDNGSGVAALLELARILSRSPQRSSIMFVFFGAEEVDRKGSVAFVNEYITANSVDVIGMINIDTIGNWNDSQGNKNDYQIRLYADANHSVSLQLARRIHFASTHYPSPLEINVVNGIDREGRWGDQMSFVNAGYPAVRFIEALEDHSSREGDDTIDGLEAQYLADATKTVLSSVIGVSGGVRPPENMALRDAEEGRSVLVWEPVPGAERYVVALRSPGSLIFTQDFTVTDSRTPPWDGWTEYEAVAVAAVDSKGFIGPLSNEYGIQRSGPVQ